MPARTCRSTRAAYRSRSTAPLSSNGVTLMVTTDSQAARTLATDIAPPEIACPNQLSTRPECSRHLAGRPHHHRREPRDLCARHVEGQPGHAHRTDRLATVVEYHCTDTPDPGHVLLVVQRPTPGPDAGEVGQQRFCRGERVRHPPGQAGTGGDPAYLVVRQRGQDRLADRGAVQRKRGTDARTHA